MALTDQLQAWYKMEENNGSSRQDSTANDLDLAEAGAGGVDRNTGKIGFAAAFDGSGAAWLARSPIITSGAFTFAGWFYVNIADVIVLLSQSTLTTTYQKISVNDAGAVFGFSNSSAQTVTSADGVFSGATWFHVAFTNDGTTAKLYVNSNLEDTQLHTPDYNAGADLAIWAELGSGQVFAGRADMVGVWSRAITLAEVQQLYNSGNGLDYPFVSEIYHVVAGGRLLW